MVGKDNYHTDGEEVDERRRRILKLPALGMLAYTAIDSIGTAEAASSDVQIIKQDLTGDGTDDIRLENGEIFVQINGENIGSGIALQAVDEIGRQGNGVTDEEITANPANPTSSTTSESPDFKSLNTFKITKDTGTEASFQIVRNYVYPTNDISVEISWKVTLFKGDNFILAELTIKNTDGGSLLLDQDEGDIHDGIMILKHLQLLGRDGDDPDYRFHLKNHGTFNFDDFGRWSTFSGSDWGTLFDDKDALTAGLVKGDTSPKQWITERPGGEAMSYLTNEITLDPGESASWLLVVGAHQGGSNAPDAGQQIYNTAVDRSSRPKINIADPTLKKKILTDQIVPYDKVQTEFSIDAENIDDDILLIFDTAVGYAKLETSGGDTEPIEKTVGPSKNKITDILLTIDGAENSDVETTVIDGDNALSLTDSIKVTAEFNGRSKTFTLTPQLEHEDTSITYPNFSSELRNNFLSTDDTGQWRPFYLQGDEQWHHPNDSTVRKIALKAAVFNPENGGFGPFPKTVFDRVDKKGVAYNIFRLVDDYLDDEAGEGLAVPDASPEMDEVGLADLINDGEVALGDDVGPWICWGQAYAFNAFARTLGIPSREINLGLALPTTCNFTGSLEFHQEGAAQIWFEGQWHYFDLYWSLHEGDYSGAVNKDIEVLTLDDYLSEEKNFQAPNHYDPVAYHAAFAFEQESDETISPPGHNWSIITTDCPPPPLIGFDDHEQWEDLARDQNTGHFIVVLSPVRLQVTDEEGQTTGFDSGSIQTEIPGAGYVPPDRKIFKLKGDPETATESEESVSLPDKLSGDFTARVTGQEDGEYSIVFSRFKELARHEAQFGGSNHATLPISNGETQEFEFTLDNKEGLQIQQVPASIDFDPDTLRKNGEEKWVTAYIELGDNSLGIEVSDINISTVELNGVDAVDDEKHGFVSDPKYKDRDEDGFKELMVKFPHDKVADALDTGDNIEVIVTGEVDDRAFKGKDTIRVVNRGNS